MDLLSYFKSSVILNAQQCNALRDDSITDNHTYYQHIYENLSNQKFGLSFEKLSEITIELARHDGVVLSILTRTAGFSCDASFYRVLGGADEKNTSYIIPLQDKSTREYVIVTSRPDDKALMDKLQKHYGTRKYSIALCDPEAMSALHMLFVEPILMERQAEQLAMSIGGSSVKVDAVKHSEARDFYRRLVNVGIERGASDARFIPCSNTCHVQFRIDGENMLYTKIPKDILERICNIILTDGGISVPNPNDPIDGKVRYSPSNDPTMQDGIDLRISIIPSKAGKDLNIRYLSNRLYTFEELGMTPRHVEEYKRLLNMPSGMIVQVGPTGSGKSTTLYAGLSYIHSSLRNIITVEDPVEIQMDGISQIDVDPSNPKKLGFAGALKACLRHDPDVIVVGELRDNETAALAVRAANTGHLVITSLHTNDSIGVFERMINMGIESYSLGEVLTAIMGQRLVRRLCPHCKEAYAMDLKSERAKFFRLPNLNESITLYRARGCVHCHNTGYAGRIAINEIMLVDTTMRSLIQRRGIRSVFEKHLRSSGFRTMYHDGIDKVLAGITSLEEMEKFAHDTIAFKG